MVESPCSNATDRSSARATSYPAGRGLERLATYWTHQVTSAVRDGQRAPSRLSGGSTRTRRPLLSIPLAGTPERRDPLSTRRGHRASSSLGRAAGLPMSTYGYEIADPLSRNEWHALH